MEDRNSGTAGASRASRRSSTEAAGLANDSPARPLGGTEVGNTDTEQNRGFMGRVREKASTQLSAQKDRATEGLGSAAQAVKQSTNQLREQRHETIAHYVEQAADQLDRFANRLKDKNVGEIVDDAQRFARRQPALFVGGAFAVGLLGSRFFKSSSTSRQQEFQGYGGDSYRSGPQDRSVYGASVGTSGTYDVSPGTTGSISETSRTSGPSKPTGTSGEIGGKPRDLPGTESF
jgi:ElaB/YqjD/DUF883 family membrane-anchored ribosome-binding protein